MAIPVNIDELINHRVVESTRIEYKSDFPNARKALSENGYRTATVSQDIAGDH